MSRADSLGSFAGNVTAEKISLSNIKLTPSSAPSSPVQGDMYLDNSDYNLKTRNKSWHILQKYKTE